MVDLIEHAKGKLDGVFASIVATPGMRGHCCFFLQSSQEENKPTDIADYVKPTLTKYQAIHNHTYEAYLKVSMLLSLDRSIYGKLAEDLSDSYSMEVPTDTRQDALHHRPLAEPCRPL